MKAIASLFVLFASLASASDPPTPKAATKDAPFVNSLGMRFVPVEITGGPTNGKRVLFSVWDTRVQDWNEYAKAKGITPAKPDFKQGPTHPVITMTWKESETFCQWLTEKERATAKIRKHDEYRLPSDHEWSCAVGIGKLEKAEDSPNAKSMEIHLYPWGKHWPPPKGSGNYGRRLHVDNYDATSPVGTFPANPDGLYDIGGNVWQWCADPFDNDTVRVIRGSCWREENKNCIRSSARAFGDPVEHYDDIGFRCVLEVSSD